MTVEDMRADKKEILSTGIIIPEILNSERLNIRQIEVGDADEMFKEFTPEVTTFMYPKPAESIEDVDGFIKSSIESNKRGTNCQMVITGKTGEFIGCVGLHNLDSKTPEFGIWIKKSAGGHGYGKEAIQMLKRWADENLLFDYFLYPVDKDNAPSKKIAESVGGKIEREYEEVNASGRKLNLIEYRIYPNKK